METGSEKSLSAELDGYRRECQEARERIRKLIDGLNGEQFNWRPGENQWSVAECLDHLTVLGTLMMKKIDEGIAKGEANAWKNEGPFKYGFLGNKFVALASDGAKARKRKLKAPKLYTPSSNHTISRLEKAFDRVQIDLIERIERANGLDLARIKVPSPALALLRLSLGQWFALLTGHQRRHFLQAEEVREQLPKE